MKITDRIRFIFSVVVSYLLFGTFWILFSDKMLLSFSDIQALNRFSILKGLLFIIITDLLLFFALTGIPDRDSGNTALNPDEKSENFFGIRVIKGRYSRWAVNYGIAVVVTLTMLILRMQIAVSFANRPMLILFMMPIILSSALGGLGPGLLSTAISAVGIDYYGIPPLESLKIKESHDLFQWFMMIVSGIMSSYLCELLHRARRHADERRLLQEKAQRDLKLSEERFRLAMKGANDGLWDWDMTTDVVYLSPRWKSMLGYGADELDNHLDSWKNVVHPEDMDRTLKQVNDILDGKIDRFEAEFRLRHKNGSYLDIISRAFPAKDNDGRIVRLVGTHVDVTERKRSEKALREKDLLLARTSWMAKVGGWTFDVEKGKGKWTDEVARIHDVEPDQEIDMGYELSFYRGKHRDLIEKAMMDAIVKAVSFDLELELVSDKGNLKWIHTIGFPVKENGKVVKVEGVFQDISDRKYAELELQTLNADLEKRVDQRTAELTYINSELESFTYAVSHDLRAPLRAMGGFSHALIEDYGDKLGGEARVYLDQIIKGSRKMGELIDGLLTLSRCSRSQVKREKMDVSAMAERTLGELKERNPERVVNWTVEPGLTVYADPVMMESVMSNLVENAWKYTSKCEEAVIRMYSVYEDGKRFFCVEDNGAGFDENHSAKLFQPFQRLHRQEEFPGIGIGLATVKRIVNRHGGEMRARGKKDSGAVFCFSVPDNFENGNGE